MVKATPNNFQFSVKVPENITHIKRLDSRRHATVAFQEFLDKISPLKDANKLGMLELTHIRNCTRDLTIAGI